MKILTAGKTSSKRAALLVARELGLPAEGRCCKTQSHLRSSQRNIKAADGTIHLSWSRAPHSQSPTMPAILH